MKFPMGNIDHHCMIHQLKNRLFFHVSVIIKYDQAYFPLILNFGYDFRNVRISVISGSSLMG
jgi:hypothetical protein